MLRRILYLVHLCPCPGLYPFMSYLCNPFLTFNLIFILINHIISLKQKHLFFVHFLEYLILVLDDNMDKKVLNFQIAKIQPHGIA